jgi:hypothetical protein
MIEDSKLEAAGATPAWKAVETVLKKHHHNVDTEAARAVYSAVAAHRLEGAPAGVQAAGLMTSCRS